MIIIKANKKTCIKIKNEKHFQCLEVNIYNCENMIHEKIKE